MKIIIEDSVDEFHVIDLSDYAEIKIDKDCKQYAGGGYYYEMLLRRHGENKFRKYEISSNQFHKYRECMELNISPEEYDIYKRIEKLRRYQ